MGMLFLAQPRPAFTEQGDGLGHDPRVKRESSTWEALSCIARQYPNDQPHLNAFVKTNTPPLQAELFASETECYWCAVGATSRSTGVLERLASKGLGYVMGAEKG